MQAWGLVVTDDKQWPATHLGPLFIKPLQYQDEEDERAGLLLKL